MTKRHERLHVRRGRLVFALVCVAVACLSGPTTAQEDDGDATARARTKLDRMLQEAVDNRRDEVVRVIVRKTSGELGALRTIVEDLGHDIIHEFASIGALTVKLAVEDLLELAADPAVASISSDGKLGADPIQRESGPRASNGTHSVLITTTPGRVSHVLADLAMHRDEVTTSDDETHVIAANVHAGDVDVLARNPSVVSIAIYPSRQSRR